MLIFVPIMVYCINGASDFWSAFWQMTAIFMIGNIFDRLFIDEFWVGHTKAWLIPGTEDLMPYIPVKVKIKNGLAGFAASPGIGQHQGGERKKPGFVDGRGQQVVRNGKGNGGEGLYNGADFGNGQAPELIALAIFSGAGFEKTAQDDFLRRIAVPLEFPENGSGGRLALDHAVRTRAR